MLEIRNLKKSFNSKEVLKDVSFSVKKGEIICLLGNNGSGKTTIINCILRMIKPDSGIISLNGKEIAKYKNSDYFSKVNALLESSVNIYDFLTGRQNIEYFAGLMNIDHKDARIDKYIKLFELEDAIDENVGVYSRGMQQKLALIISLMSSPQLLLLDEPTLGLDIKSKLSVIKVLNEIVEEEQLSVILTTHQMYVIQKLNSRILILKDGRVFDFEKEKYNQQLAYSVSYIKENLVEQVEIEGTFVELYERFSSAYEVVEIKRKEKDIEEIMVEALDETN